MLDNQIIIVQNGKIKEVGTNLNINKTDNIIDLSNSWVLPGLMDCHVHITLNVPYRNVQIEQMYLHESTSLRAIRGTMVAKQFLDNGFITIKEIGNDANYATADIIKAIRHVGNDDLQYVRGYSCVYSLTNTEIPYVTNAITNDIEVDTNFVLLGSMSGIGAKGSLAYGLIASNLLSGKTDTSEMYQKTSQALGTDRLIQDLKDMDE